MSILSSIKDRLTSATRKYTADDPFLHAAAAAAANVIAADGTIEEAEVEAGVSGMMANPILSKFFPGTQIEKEVNAALTRAKTISGRIQNKRAVEAVSTRSSEIREDIFLIAADTTSGNSNGMGDAERKALTVIAAALNLDASKLLG